MASNAVTSGIAPSPPAVTPQHEAVVIDAPARQRPRDVRDMSRPELEAYAMELRMLPRALELCDDRLRQNIMAFLAEMFENATGS